MNKPKNYFSSIETFIFWALETATIAFVLAVIISLLGLSVYMIAMYVPWAPYIFGVSAAAFALVALFRLGNTAFNRFFGGPEEHPWFGKNRD